MIETAMIFALGFLVASAIGFVLLNAVWRRAVRLTTKRVESTLPLSMIEIKADKDQLRAEFAIATRKLEINLDKLREQAHEQMAEIGLKTETIRALKGDIADRDETIAALEQRHADQDERLREANRQIIERQSALEAVTLALKAKEADLRAAHSTISDKDIEADRTRIDLVSMQTQIEHLRLNGKRLEAELAAAEEARAAMQKTMADTTEALTTERQHMMALREEITGLTTSLAEKSAFASGLENEITTLKNELAGLNARMRVEQGERDRLEKALVEAHGHLLSSKDEITGLKARLADLESLAADQPSATALDRSEAPADNQEKAEMRQKINEIAAEVARMTLALEGRGSPIEKILAENPPRQDNTTLSSPVSLADRVRALRNQAAISKSLN